MASGLRYIPWQFAGNRVCGIFQRVPVLGIRVTIFNVGSFETGHGRRTALRQGHELSRSQAVPLEYSIGWLTCAFASSQGAVMVGWPGATQDRLPAGSPATRPSRPGTP